MKYLKKSDSKNIHFLFKKEKYIPPTEDEVVIDRSAAENWHKEMSAAERENLRNEIEDTKKGLLAVLESIWEFLMDGKESFALFFKSDESITKMLKAFENKPTTEETLEYHIKLMKALNHPLFPDAAGWNFYKGEKDAFPRLEAANVQYFVGIDDNENLVRAPISSFSGVSVLRPKDEDWKIVKFFKTVGRGAEQLANKASEAVADQKVTVDMDDLIEYEEALLEAYRNKDKAPEASTTQSTQSKEKKSHTVTPTQRAYWNHYKKSIEKWITFAYKKSGNIPLGKVSEIIQYKEGVAKRVSRPSNIKTYEDLETHYTILKRQLSRGIE